MTDQRYPITAAQVRKQLDAMFTDLILLEADDVDEGTRQYAEQDYKIRMQVVKDLTSETETRIESEFVTRFQEEIRKATEQDYAKRAHERLHKALGRKPYMPKGDRE